MESCLICDRIRLIKRGENKYFVKELKSGYVVLGDHQFFRGYTLLLSKVHVTELHKLTNKDRKQFLLDMSLVAEAVFKTFKPRKLNYELLGNTDSHIHWHLFPRYEDDPKPDRVTWTIPLKVRKAREAEPNDKELRKLKAELLRQLEALTK